MPLSLIDSHVHLDDLAFDEDRDAVLARARAAGIRDMVIPAITAATWPHLRDVCRDHPDLHPAYGLHPMFLAQHAPGDLDSLEQWLRNEPAVAVGECGLDFHVEGLDPDIQRGLFRRQLEIARAHDLPVIIHARKAVEEVIHTIRSIGHLRGVIHSYSGSPEQARQLHDLGFLIGLGGPVTYARARRLQRVAASVPIDQLLLETDAPDQPDAEHRGSRNEPARLPHVAACIAALRDISINELADATSVNARRLFRLP